MKTFLRKWLRKLRSLVGLAIILFVVLVLDYRRWRRKRRGD